MPWDASKYGTRSGGRKFNQYIHPLGDHYVVVTATDSDKVKTVSTTLVGLTRFTLFCTKKTS